MDVEHAVVEWREGERALAAEPPARRATLERIADAVLAELRRRLGGAYTVEELAQLYAAGTDWCLELAMAVAPDEPDAWEGRLVADAAFARYVNGAVDYGGGRIARER